MMMKPELIEAVWAHGRVMPEADAAHWRQDACGAWMRREHFSREDSEFGWKLEKIFPGGGESVENLRPFHWRNRYDISSGRPHCRVSADRSNVPAEKYANPPRNREV
jgi:hypothetical protein